MTPATAPALASSGLARRRSLLAIDDDPVQLAIVGGIADRAGLRVVKARSADEALSIIKGETFDLATIDLSLPDRDGVEILRALASSGSEARVVIVSGSDARVQRTVLWIARKLGLVEPIAVKKPIDAGRLLSVFARARLAAVADDLVAPFATTAEGLVRAIRDGEIVPHFQPKVDLRSGAIVGCEALARWARDDGTIVPPALFLPGIERHGLMEALLTSMLERSLDAALSFQRGAAPVGVAVNAPASALADRDFPPRVEGMLRRHGLPPGALTIEVTESDDMSDVASAIALARLRLIGVNVSIDDFGTGFSSLSSLASLPFSELKLDRSFVTTCDSDSDLLKIARAPICLAKQLGLKVVAEGVETREVAELIAAEGCDMGQGLLYSPAVAAAELRQLISNGPRPA